MAPLRPQPSNRSSAPFLSGTSHNTVKGMPSRTGARASPSRSERVLAGQNHVLRLLAEGQSLEVALEALCRAHEAVIPGAACSVLLLDEAGERLRHAAAPSLPRDYAALIDGLRIGPMAGSCGTAAYLQRPVIVSNIDTDPLWANWRALAHEHGLRACWSLPIFDRESGRLLGTFAVYYREPREPDAEDFALVERSSDLAGVAITHARALAALVEAQEASNQTESQFLAMTSHELRTPLQAVLGYAEFLLSDASAALTAEQRDDLRFIEQGGQRMLAIINQMLDLSRIEAGRLDLVRQPVDLARILEQVRRDVAPWASQKGLQLDVVLPPELPLVWADTERLCQALLNLAGNAVKFTEHGSVSIAVEPLDGQVAIAVRDTGIGIAAEDIPHVFAAFRQVERRLVRRHGGAGLGLAIAQKLVELMGGRITVQSTLGGGSIFTVRMPAASSAAC